MRSNLVPILELGRNIGFGISNGYVNWYGQCWEHPWRVYGLWIAYGAPGDRSLDLSGASRALRSPPQRPTADSKIFIFRSKS